MAAFAQVTDTDFTHLRRCIALARESVEAGDEPFGSVLVANSDPAKVLAEDRNRINTLNDATYHPEIKLAQWAQKNISEPAERAATTMYTSGEHCPMCSAAHAWCGLGRIVYVASGKQLVGWMGDSSPSPVAGLSINEVAPKIEVVGPVRELGSEIRDLHFERRRRRYDNGK